MIFLTSIKRVQRLLCLLMLCVCVCVCVSLLCVLVMCLSSLLCFTTSSLLIDNNKHFEVFANTRAKRLQPHVDESVKVIPNVVPTAP
jgi:hypothetical protein